MASESFPSISDDAREQLNNADSDTGEISKIETAGTEFLKAHGFDEGGLDPAKAEAERREWQEMGLQKDVENASRQIAEKAYDNMPGPDSPDAEGREYQISALEKTVHEASGKIASEAYDVLGSKPLSMEDPENIGENVKKDPVSDEETNVG